MFSFTKLLIYFFIYHTFSYSIVISTVIKGQLPEPIILSKVLQEFLQPVVTNNVIENPHFRTKNIEIDKVIEEKIAELQNYLHDNDALDENKLLLEDRDDTTIIEFLPKTEPERNKTATDDHLKRKLKKFKKLREKIKKALEKESVSHKTKHLVFKTFDDLIKTMLESQCKWKRNLRAEKIEEPSTIAKRWNEGLHNIKAVMFNLFSNKNIRRTEVSKVLDNIQVLFDNVAVDIETISKKYKIQCEFIPKNQHSNVLRNAEQTDMEDDKCTNLVICSNELREFMYSLYATLNDTAINVIGNYIEMYIRDVIVDGRNETSLVDVIRKIIQKLEINIQEIFIKETQKFKLDKEKKVDQNVKYLSRYVKRSVKNVKSTADIVLASELGYTDKIHKIIKDDINVNMDVELGNLEREFVTKICTIFHICNSKYKGRRQFSEKLKNNLFVEVALTVEDVDIESIQDGRKNLPTSLHFNVTRTTST